MTALAFSPRSAPALPSAQDLLARYGGPVPRYTSYPTAPHFGPQVDAGTYAQWLAALPPGADVSLYLHVPFCAELCLYCGCQTSVARSYTPVAAFTDRLLEEIALVAQRRPEKIDAIREWEQTCGTVRSYSGYSSFFPAKTVDVTCRS